MSMGSPGQINVMPLTDTGFYHIKACVQSWAPRGAAVFGMSLADKHSSKHFLLLHRFQDWGTTLWLIRIKDHLFCKKAKTQLQDSVSPEATWAYCLLFAPCLCPGPVHPRLYKHRMKSPWPWRAHNPNHTQEDYTQRGDNTQHFLEYFGALPRNNLQFWVCWMRTEFQDCWAFYPKRKRESGAASLLRGLGWVSALIFLWKPLRHFKSPSLTPVQLCLMSTDSAKRTTLSEH